MARVSLSLKINPEGNIMKRKFKSAFNRYEILIICKIIIMLNIFPIYLNAQNIESEENTAQKTNEVTTEAGIGRGEYIYRISGNNCSFSFTVESTILNKLILMNRARCSWQLQAQMPFLKKLLDVICDDYEDSSQLHKLYWGRLTPSSASGILEMSKRLALAAKRSPDWDSEKGRLLSEGHINDFVAKLANERGIYKELKDLFHTLNLNLTIDHVEKVLVGSVQDKSYYHELQQFGVNTSDKLPFDCMVCFRINSKDYVDGMPIRFSEDGLWGYGDSKGKVIVEPYYFLAYEFTKEGIAAVADSTGWVYIDTGGRILIRPFIFDNAPDMFREGLARFVENGRFGYFDEYGKVVIKAQFDFSTPFNEDLAAFCKECQRVYAGEHWSMQGGKWGYINRAGKIVISAKFDAARSFKNSKAQVNINGQWKLINKSGKILD
jgi:hypothetical protein